MKPSNFFRLIGNSVVDVFKNPILFFIGALMFGVLTLFSKISAWANASLTTSVSLTVSLIIFFLVFLLISSAFFGWMIIVSSRAARGKKENWRGKFSTWIINFCILLIIVILSILIDKGAFYAGIALGQFFNLSLVYAQVTYFCLYLVGLLGILIFFSYANTILFTHHLSFGSGIGSSFSLVKKNYFSTLGLLVLLFVLFYLVQLISNMYVAEVVEYILLAPLVAMIYARFVILNKRSKSSTEILDAQEAKTRGAS